MNNNIPIFIINLPKDKDRRDFMEKQMKDLNLAYEFIEGRMGHDEEVIASCDDDTAIKQHGKILSRGEKGCAFSHRLIYERMERDSVHCAFILEDDAVLPKNIEKIISSLVLRNTNAWDWLSFDYPKIGIPFVVAWIKASFFMSKKNPIFILYVLIKFPFIIIISIFEVIRNFLAKFFGFYAGPKLFYRPLYNAGAYLVTLGGIKKMKPLLYPIRFSADRTPNIARLKAGLKMRWYVPRIAHQAEEDIGNTFTSNTLT